MQRVHYGQEHTLCHIEPNLRKLLLLFDIKEMCYLSIYSHDGCSFEKKHLKNCEAVYDW